MDGPALESLPEAWIVWIIEQHALLVGEGYSNDEALSMIEAYRSQVGTGEVPNPLNLSSYITYRVHLESPAPIPEEYFDWAIGQAKDFVEEHGTELVSITQLAEKAN